MKDVSGIVALLEYMDRKSAQPKANKVFKKPKAPKLNKFDLSEIPAFIEQEKSKLDKLEKFVKDFYKKEDKKPENKGLKFNGLEWFIIGILLHPVIGQIYTALMAGVK